MRDALGVSRLEPASWVLPALSVPNPLREQAPPCLNPEQLSRPLWLHCSSEAGPLEGPSLWLHDPCKGQWSQRYASLELRILLSRPL